MAATPSYVESLICSAKRLKISSSTSSPVLTYRHRKCISSSSPSTRPSTVRAVPRHALTQSRSATQAATPSLKQHDALKTLRLPKAVQAIFLAPLKRAATHGIPVCDLQIRSYSVRNLEIWADFCMRAAYYLNLAAKGPVPLPRITERWTVPRSNFVHKKSQENFERKTLRRLIQIQDGHPETVALWLAYIQKHRYYGVGMKANVFEYGGLEVAKDLDAENTRLQTALGDMPQSFMREDEARDLGVAKLEDMLSTQPFKGQWGAYGPMGGTAQITRGRRRFRKINAEGRQSNEDVQLRTDPVLRPLRRE